MPQDKNDRPDTTCAAYDDMAVHWPLLDALLGGMDGMRAGGTTWLPKFKKEESIDWTARLNSSFLFNAYGDTVNQIAAKPFGESITIKGTAPKALADIERDVDGTGKNLTQLGLDLYTGGVVYGKAHILVDYEARTDESGNPIQRTLAEENESKDRPRLIYVSAKQLLSWRYDVAADGKPTLTQICIAESVIEPVGMFGEKTVQQVRVITPSEFAVYRKRMNEKGQQIDEWYMVPELSGKHTLGKVPLITVYFRRTGYLTAEPPLLSLAETNLEHWQSSSDQRNILHFARVPILYGTGMSQTQIDEGITISPHKATLLRGDGKLGYLEPQGAAITAGAEDLKRLEEQMETLGLQPQMTRMGGVTATQSLTNEERTMSEAQAWVRNAETGLLDAYKLAGEWIKAEVPEDFAIDIFSDWTVDITGDQDITQLREIRKQGDLSQKTFLEEVQRRNLISDTVDLDMEIEAIGMEPPKLAMGFGGDTGEDGTDV